jgi:acyl-CoA reductase-like NAD-dependent aldehyde dehydrogenase
VTAVDVARTGTLLGSRAAVEEIFIDGWRPAGAGELWEQHASELEDWLIRETGAIRAKASLELHIAANECYEAAALPTLPQGEVLATNEARWSFARRRPAGVVSVIAPLNFPLILSIRSVAPALALGNAVVLGSSRSPVPRPTGGRWASWRPGT